MRPFFGGLIARDPGGGSWLGQLLAATPHGKTVFAGLLSQPGAIDASLAKVRTNGLLGCFEFGVPAPKALLAWYVEHPDDLAWPRNTIYSEKTTKMRRALLYDSPPGQEAAQEEARKLIATSSAQTRGWWRFEGVSTIDCLLMTDRLVISIEGKRTEPLSAATDWYPERSQLVRNLEAAKQLAHGRAWASLLISEDAIPEGSDAGLDGVLASSAPHLDEAEHRELHAHYLGNITWRQACSATAFEFEMLPSSTADI